MSQQRPRSPVLDEPETFSRAVAAGSLRRVARGARWALHLLARPASRWSARRGVEVRPYRGYASRREAFLMGRVFRQPIAAPASGGQGLGGDLLALAARLLHWGLADAEIEARLGQARRSVTTDRDGYFRVALPVDGSRSRDGQWLPVELELIRPPKLRTQTQGEVFLPPDRSRFAVISDIDDTILYTGVANKLKMLWRLYVQRARSRTGFPGMAAFCRGLHRGSSGDEQNPMLYVSRGPWSLYEVLEEFFHMNDIPVGPILFLREWGLTLQRPLPRRAVGHKLEVIRDIVSRLDGLPLVLIGDSGQHDPEIYSEIVRLHPESVRAIYIRNVSRDVDRTSAIAQLAGAMEEAGSPLILASDSFVMAEHAAREGLISKQALADVLAERTAEIADASP